jgi:hypothetical protein
MHDHDPSPLTVTNRSAAVGWAFMAIWLAMLAVFTWLFVRDGGFHQFSYPTEVATIALFWLAGISGAVWVCSHPVIRIDRQDQHLVVCQTWPHRSSVESVGIAALPPPRLTMERDDEGDLYFRCMIDMPDGRTVTFLQTPDKAQAEAAVEAFRRAL